MTAEQRMLSQSAARFVASHAGSQAIEASRGGTHWRQMADLGWLGVGIAEESGGFGGTLSDQTVILIELGRGLAVEPYVNSSIAAATILTALAPGRAPLIGSLVEGQSIAVPAILESDRVYRPLDSATSLVATGGQFLLSGNKVMVGDGDLAQQLIVSCRDQQGDSFALALVPFDAPGLKMTHRSSFAGTVVTELELRDVAIAPEAVLARGPAARAALTSALLRATIGWCALATGAACTAFEQTLDYVKVRQQFGRAIGEFQALQHRLADMYIAVTEAAALVDMASVQADEGTSSDLERAVLLARAGVFRRVLLVAREAVQLHGGMGMTEEMIVGRAFRYIKMLDIAAGSPEQIVSHELADA